MFRLNSPLRPRTSTKDLRVRLAHPFFPRSIVNQRLQESCREARQPLIVSARNACVKRREKNLEGFSPARFHRLAPCTRLDTELVRCVFPGSRRALILPTDHRRDNPFFEGSPARVPL